MMSQPGGSDPATHPAGSPGSKKSSSSLTMSQLPVKQKKRLLEIEASRKRREFEKAQSILERELERQIGEAEVLVKQVTDVHHRTVLEVGGRAMVDLPPDLALRYRDTFSEVTLNNAKAEHLRNQLKALRDDVLEEHKRIQEELKEEKEKIDILFEDDTKLDAGDDALLKEFDIRHPDVGGAHNPATIMNRSRLPKSEPRKQAPLDLRNERANPHHQEHEYEREGQREGGATSLGVQELVTALGCAFGGTHGVEKKLPSFSGCPGEWLTFRSAYDMMNKPRKLQPSIMMRRLGEALKGDARIAVQHLLSNPDNLHKLMEVLERRFGRAEFVFDYLVGKVKSCKPADMKNPKSIIDFGTSVEALVENIKSYRKHDYLRDKSLQQQLVEKLPGTLQYRWHEYLMDNDIQDVDLLELSFWLNKQVMIAERQVKPTVVEPEPEKKRERKPRKRNHGGVHGAAGNDDEQDEMKNCLFCDKAKHSISTCYSFKKKTVQERSEFVKTKGACFLCLVKGHMTTACKSKMKCEVKGCGKRHHTLLHRLKESKKTEQQQSDEEEDEDENVYASSAPPAEKVIGAAASANILAVIPVKVKGPAGTMKIYAMLDLGASFSMIEEGVAAELGLTGVKEQLNYTVFGDKRSEDSLKTTVEVSGVMKKAKFYGVKTIHTVKKIGLPSRTFNAEEFKIKYPHLRNMRASSMRNAKPQMVIGINAGGLFAARQILELSPGEMPAAIKSLLGWYVVQDEETMLKQFQYLCKCREKEEEMNMMMKNFFSTEAFGVQPCNMEGRSKDDIRALSLLDENTTYDGSRWSSCLLWKDDNISLPPSKNMAMKRLTSMEKKMDRDPDFAKSWTEEIPQVEEIRVPRKLSPISMKDCSSIEVHCFVDASQDSFAAVSYLRIDTGGSVVTPFIMGKARVAPLRRMSIPRMELQAAVMGARMVNFIMTAMNDEVKIIRKMFWSDSKTVLCWIRSTSGRFNVFVSNRIGELAELTNVNEWRWIPTKLNVADDPTRPSTVDLRSDSRWLTGPEFLLKDESKWPTEDHSKTKQEVSQADLEMKILCAAVEDSSRTDIRNILSAEGRKLKGLLNLNFPTPPKISNWFRLICATAQGVRAVRLFKGKKMEGSRFLTLKDMKTARYICIMRAQQEMFPEEVKLLEAGKSVGNKSRLYSLNPAMNELGIIVHKGRIDNAKRNKELKAPPILDPAHPYTKMMVTFFHEAGGHWGQERVMNELRRLVWILDVRAAVRRAWARCLKCQIRRAAPRPPQMGQLPEAKLEVKNPPFYHCGVDCFGPYEVKVLRSTIKRYGVLFTCLTTRAVHLELAQSLDSNDFMNCLARFISVRGKPAHLWSDNGKNFVGAERELREVVQRLQEQGIQEMAMTKEIEFHFICPVSPHMGGSWERLIGSVKRILSSLIKEHHPKEDTLRTFLYEVMGIMNSRPITYASVDPDDDLCLTPNHLLNVPCVVGPTIPSDGDGGDRMRKSWRQCQLLAEDFWRRFSTEYLPWLSKRQKWISKVEPLQVGDVVMVLEDNVPRNCWKKGLIQKVIMDKAGQVRSAVVRIASYDQQDKKMKIKLLRRPAVKLCKLHLVGNNADAGRENVIGEAKGSRGKKQEGPGSNRKHSGALGNKGEQ